MANTAALYDETRRTISDLVRALPEDRLHGSVPATPEWSIRDIVCHLAGDVASVLEGDFPREFFQSFGDADTVVTLNKWTGRHIEDRREHSLEEVLSEWEDNSKRVTPMMSADIEWPEGVPVFTDRVLLTDVTVHLHDIYGALGRKDDRDAPGIRIANAGYITTIGWRLGGTGLPPVLFVSGDSERVAGEGEPAATVRADRFEMFRALSGRRNPNQIRAFDWEGDPEPYITYFYPYGIREEALEE
ncbi:MAG TPA: maleylpyruvate isomerase family mycothiol-dependent enzyme [Actinomycetota bacterium]|nr:maleylpyruvate isomerase family mycothiol-dependent enzyme [Actinomycetota bacterium]